VVRSEVLWCPGSFGQGCGWERSVLTDDGWQSICTRRSVLCSPVCATAKLHSLKLHALHIVSAALTLSTDIHPTFACRQRFGGTYYSLKASIRPLLVGSHVSQEMLAPSRRHVRLQPTTPAPDNSGRGLSLSHEGYNTRTGLLDNRHFRPFLVTTLRISDAANALSRSA